MSLTPRTSTAGTLAVAALTAALLTSCSGGDGDAIAVGTVTRADVIETVDAAGSVTPRSQTVLTAPEDSIVSSVLISEGQRVKQGDVLVHLSSASASARLAAAQKKLADNPAPTVTSSPDLQAFAKQLDASALASFASARASAKQIQDKDAREQALEQIDQAEKSYRANRKAADKAIKQTEDGITNASAALASLGDAQHDAAVANVAAAQAAINALTIRAPFAGTVSLGGPAAGAGGGVDLSGIAQSLGGATGGLGGVDLSAITGGGSSSSVTTAQIEPGANLTKGTPVATVVDATSLSVTANVDETDILAVKLGNPASVDLDAVPGAEYPGNVIGIDQLPATTSGGSVTYRVRLTLRSGSDADGHLAAKPRAGMSAVARITVETSKDALSVPASAIVRESGRDSIWLIRDGKAHLTGVTLAAQGADVVAIESSSEGTIKDGDRVVIKGADRVKEGKKLS